MNLSKIKNLIIPALVLVIFSWVLSRPISAFVLFLYKNTSANINQLVTGIQATQKEAQTLLHAEKIAEKLKREKQKLLIEITGLKAKNKEAEELKRALNFKSNFAYNTVFASVIGRSPDSWHNQLIINKGSEDGVELGRGVINEKGVIGQIKKLGPHSAVVQLISNPEWRMGVKVQRLDQYCILNGNYPRNARLKFVPIDSDIQAGDEIVSSGICTEDDACPYPENFPVGKVVMVGKDPNEIDLVVEVKYHAELHKTKYVYVLKK